MGNVESIIQAAYSVEDGPRPNLRKLGSREASDLKLEAFWTEDRKKADRRIERFMEERKKASKKWDKSAQQFALSRAYFSRGYKEIEWECTGIP